MARRALPPGAGSVATKRASFVADEMNKYPKDERRRAETRSKGNAADVNLPVLV